MVPSSRMVRSLERASSIQGICGALSAPATVVGTENVYLVELTFYRGRFRQKQKCKMSGDDVRKIKPGVGGSRCRTILAEAPVRGELALKIWGRGDTVPGRGNCQCKGLEASMLGMFEGQQGRLVARVNWRRVNRDDIKRGRDKITPGPMGHGEDFENSWQKRGMI